MTNQEAQQIISETLNIPLEEAEVILKKAKAGQEFIDDSEIERWLNERFLPNIVYIDEEGYAKMCIDALKIQESTAATDFGNSRQRDLGQLWADMTRGYLGEQAFVLFLKNKFGIEAEMGHEKGKLEDYLPMDIHKIKLPSESELRSPNIKIGIKTVKWNGIWFDVGGAQFHHSDIHVLVKVGTGRDHLFAFFKHLSVFKDKVLKKGVEVGSLNDSEAQTLFDRLPTFAPIPAYICGFTLKDETYSELSYQGKKGRKHYKVSSWRGPINPGDLDRIKEREGITGDVKFLGIENFSHDKGYLFNAGNLLWELADWKQLVIEQL